MDDKSAKESMQEMAQLLELLQAEEKRSVPLLQRIASMIGNESTLNEATLKQIDDSIENLQLIRQVAKRNREWAGDLCEPIIDWATIQMDQHKHAKELHYIHGTRTGAKKRQDATEYIEENIKIEKVKKYKKRLETAKENFSPEKHLKNIKRDTSTEKNSNDDCPKCGREDGLKYTASCACGYIPPENQE